jgi:hypothetical protein
MEHRKATLLASCSLMALAALAAVRFATGAATEPEVERGQAPAASLEHSPVETPLWVGGAPPFEATLYARIEKRWDPRPALRLTWMPTAQMPRSIERSYPVDFWPTAATALPGRRLVVAGKETNGATRVELWRFGHEVSAQTGAKDPIVTPPDVEGVDLLYSQDVEGRRVVRNVFAARGAEARVFVQFHDSGDIHALDWSQGDPSLTLLFLASALPVLADVRLDSAMSGTHAGLGSVYWIANSKPLGAIFPLFVMLDRDSDGVIDQAEVWGKQQFDSLGILDATRYSEVNFMK